MKQIILLFFLNALGLFFACAGLNTLLDTRPIEVKLLDPNFKIQEKARNDLRKSSKKYQNAIERKLSLIESQKKYSKFYLDDSLSFYTAMFKAYAVLSETDSLYIPELVSKRFQFENPEYIIVCDSVLNIYFGKRSKTSIRILNNLLYNSESSIRKFSIDKLKEYDDKKDIILVSRLIDELESYKKINARPDKVIDILKIFKEELKPHLSEFQPYLSNREICNKKSYYTKDLVKYILEIDPQSDLKGYGLFISDFLPTDGLKISMCNSNYKERIALHRSLWRIMNLEYYETPYQEYGDYYLNRLISPFQAYDINRKKSRWIYHYDFQNYLLTQILPPGLGVDYSDTLLIEPIIEGKNWEESSGIRTIEKIDYEVSTEVGILNCIIVSRKLSNSPKEYSYYARNIGYIGGSKNKIVSELKADNKDVYSFIVSQK